MDRNDVDRIASRAESAARGWVGLLGVLLCVTLPVLWVERLDGGDRSDEYLSVWGAVAALLGDELDGSGDGNYIAIAGLVALGLGLVGALYVSTTWLTAGVEPDSVGSRGRGAVAALLVAGAALLALGAGTVPPVGPLDDDPSTGLGMGAGLWSVVLLALVMTAERVITPRR